MRTVENLSEPIPIADLAASFQDAVNRALFRKTIKAAQNLELTRIVLAGGVAANSDLRKKFESASGFTLYRQRCRSVPIMLQWLPVLRFIVVALRL